MSEIVIEGHGLAGCHSRGGARFAAGKWQLALATGLILTFGSTSEARTLEVSPTGKYPTPSAAVQAADPGDTILIRPGVYKLAKSLIIAEPNITVAGDPKALVTLEAPTAEDAGVLNAVVITGNNVTLSNLEIKGGAYYGVKVDPAEGAKNTTGVIIRNCRVMNTGRDCIKTFNADKLLIENCQITNSGVRDSSNAEGIDSIGSKGVTIRNCQIWNTATNAVYLKGGATDGMVEQCFIQNIPSHAGILLGQDTDLEYMRDGARYEAIRCTARNNIIVNTGGSGLGTFSGSDISFYNNTLYDVARDRGAGIYVGVNRRRVSAVGVSIKNNIVYTAGSLPAVYLLHTNFPDSDGNIYYGRKVTPAFEVEDYTGVRSLSLESWRDFSGVDGKSRVTDPRIDPANGYRPRRDSPAIGTGLSTPKASVN